MVTLSWGKCVGDVWCSLESVNIGGIQTIGVYIIWHGGPTPKAVYVGQGDVANRIAQHRQNLAILNYRQCGGLYVTWASVPAHQRDGVERYLAEHWNPLVGGVHPAATPIAVNSPW